MQDFQISKISNDAIWQEYQGRAGCTLFPDSKHPIYLIALFRDDKVVHMSFQGDTGLTLEQAIGILGEPTDIAISGQILVALINPDKGISFGYNDIGEPKWVYSEIRPEIEITIVVFYNPDAYEQKIDGGLFSYGSTIFPWNGYGELDILYPRP